MTKNSARKKQVRALMALHDETYTQAARRLERDHAQRVADRLNDFDRQQEDL